MNTPNPNPNPNAQPAQPAPGDRPDWLPEKFWDPDAKAPKIEELAKSYGGLEGKLGKGREAFDAERLGKRPESADKYDIAIEGIDKELIDKHPLTPLVREMAFDMGVAPEDIGPFAKKFVDALNKDLPDPAAEIAKLGPDAEARMNALDGLIGEHFKDPDEAKAASLIAHNAAGVRVLEKMFAAITGKPLGKPPEDAGEGAKPAGKTEAEIKKMMDDPRYWHPRKRDNAFVQEVTDWFKANKGTQS